MQKLSLQSTCSNAKKKNKDKLSIEMYEEIMNKIKETGMENIRANASKMMETIKILKCSRKL